MTFLKNRTAHLTDRSEQQHGLDRARVILAHREGPVSAEEAVVRVLRLRYLAVLVVAGEVQLDKRHLFRCLYPGGGEALREGIALVELGGLHRMERTDNDAQTRIINVINCL